jgi:hypothetical protein
LAEGDLLYRDQLPLGLEHGPAGERAILGSDEITQPWGLPADLGNGFHYLVLEQGEGASIRRTPLLFQVAPQAWKPYFDSLDAFTPDREQP